MKLHKLAPDWDPEDRVSAANAIQQARLKDEILTGLLYINTEYGDLHDIINTSDTPLNTMKENTLCPGTEKLDTINAGFR